MKLKVYLLKKQAMLRIPTSFFEENNIENQKQNMEINGLKFSTKINFDSYIRKDGRISRAGFVNIPKKVVDALDLKHKQEVEFNIK